MRRVRTWTYIKLLFKFWQIISSEQRKKWEFSHSFFSIFYSPLVLVVNFNFISNVIFYVSSLITDLAGNPLRQKLHD